MWDPAKRERFQELRQLEIKGALDPAQRQELDVLIKEIEDTEAAYLTPATERLRQEREELEAKQMALEELVRRKEALVARLKQVFAEAEAERQAIDREIARLLPAGERAGSGRAG